MRSIKSSRVPVRPYRELVWLAYLTLPSGVDEERRLVLAHRLAAAALEREDDGEVRARQEFLRRLLRWRIRPWSGRVAYVGAMPALTRSADAAFTAELDALPAASRAAYALLRLEGRPPEQVVEILAGAGVPDPGAAIDAVTRLEERSGDGAAHRPALDPTLARMYGRPGRPPRTKLIAGAGVCVLSVLVAVSWSRLEVHGHADPLPEPPQAARALPDAWHRSAELDLATWPARGALSDDRALVGRAMLAWGSGPAQLLYADRVDDAPVVLLHRPDQVARYSEIDGRPSLEVLPQPRTKPDGTSPLKLRTTGAGSRYLLPPWVTEVSKTELSGSEPRWRKVAVAGGVTAPVARVDGRDCWRGPVLKLRAPQIAHGMPYTMLDFGRLSLANAYYQPPPPADINRFGPSELDALPGGFSAWKAIACAIDRPEGEIQSAAAWEFWSGGLPEKGRGRWFCLRLGDATGGSSVRAILVGTSRGRTSTALTRTTSDTWDCSRLRRDLVAGAWWKAPSGKKYYVAAGSRRVIDIRLSGRGVHGREIISDRRLGGHPGLSAVNELGDTVPALQ